MTNLFEEYAQVEQQIAVLEEKKAQLRPHILEMMLDKKETRKETSLGYFSISSLKKWTFPAYIKDLEDSVKAAKAKSQSTEEATYEEVPSLKFNKLSL